MTENVITASQARALVSSVLDDFYRCEGSFPFDVHERTAATQLVVYFTEALRDVKASDGQRWNVDADYNRIGATESKRLTKLDSTLTAIARAFDWDASKLFGEPDHLVVPDIVVHRRQTGKRDRNLIACELKRRGPMDAREVAWDLAKLSGYRSELGYDHAFFVVLGRKRTDCLIHDADLNSEDIIAFLRRREWR